VCNENQAGPIDSSQLLRGTLRKVLGFIGDGEVEENLLDESIEYCSFNNLKKLEAENRFRRGNLNQQLFQIQIASKYAKER